MKTVQLFLLTFLTLCGLSVSQSSGSYYCSRLLTEITDNGMGMEQSMQWTYNEVNGTLSIMFKLVARLGWTGIGFSRPEYTGMDKAILFIGYLYSDGVVHENGCVNPYLGVGNGHPERNLSSLAKSVSYWGTNFQRESNELLVTSITIDVNSFPFEFLPTGGKLLLASNYGRSTFGLPCPLSSTSKSLPQHSSQNNLPGNIALSNFNWRSYGGKSCTVGTPAPTTKLPTVQPTPSTGTNTTQAPATPAPLTPAPTQAAICPTSAATPIVPDDKCSKTTEYSMLGSYIQVCDSELCKCVGGVIDPTNGKCSASPTCPTALCSARRYQCQINAFKAIVQKAPDCAASLSQYYTRDQKTECLRSTCGTIAGCTSDQYLGACTDATSTSGALSLTVFFSHVCLSVLLFVLLLP